MSELNSRTIENLGNRRSDQYMRSGKTSDSLKTLKTRLGERRFGRLLELIKQTGTSPDDLEHLFQYVSDRDVSKFFDKYAEVLPLFTALLRSNRHLAMKQFLEQKYGNRRSSIAELDDSYY